MVPDEYIRKQTLVNAERYITPEMKEYEALVLNAEERIKEIERRLFSEICSRLAGSANRLLQNCACNRKVRCVGWIGGGCSFEWLFKT